MNETCDINVQLMEIYLSAVYVCGQHTHLRYIKNIISRRMQNTLFLLFFFIERFHNNFHLMTSHATDLIIEEAIINMVGMVRFCARISLEWVFIYLLVDYDKFGLA